MGILLKPNGTEKVVSPKNGHDFSLKELQKLVGGTIELVHLSGGRWLVVNDEGKILGLPFNLKATLLYTPDCRDFIVGDAVYCEPSEIV